MRDGPLTIRGIIRSHLQSPEFAFLFACRDESSPDEAIRLTAAMQLPGFYSVTGYMRSVDEHVGRPDHSCPLELDRDSGG
jgi:hypothetical protein